MKTGRLDGYPLEVRMHGSTLSQGWRLKGFQVKRQWLATESGLQAFIEESRYLHGSEGK